ncbi:hypothetical protein SEA_PHROSTEDPHLAKE_33 [Gordonia phage PhrostedPhlake]|nr:hypothetical protein SEA_PHROSTEDPHLAKE_33 [Gordonia phage PhrostedPhlake]
MTIITRLTGELTGGDAASLPRLSWASGLNPNRRWVPARLPAVGVEAESWPSNEGAILANADGPIVGQEAGIKYAQFSGVSDNRLSLASLAASTMRTLLIIARPNTGDAFTGGSPVVNTSAIQVLHSPASDQATITSGVAPLPAVRDKWHVYAYSLPDTGDGAFVIDNASTTFAPSNRAQNQINVARSGGNYRQLRVLELLTSPDVFTAAQLLAAAAAAKAWYSGLAWAA